MKHKREKKVSSDIDHTESHFNGYFGILLTHIPRFELAGN